MRYKDFEGYGLTIKWSGNSSLRVYVADVCSFAASSTNPNLLLYTSIARRKSYEVSLETVESWGPKLDEDGYIYVRFNTTESGNVTFVTEKPVEEDPVITTNPCVESSIKLNVGDQLTLNLNSAFTVYCINYVEWAAQGVKLQWKGTEPLHTFVAETCEYALAPYNKYVHVYLPITTEAVLDMNALAPYVDDAGYLYVRFLTEKEGVLTTVAQ